MDDKDQQKSTIRAFLNEGTCHVTSQREYHVPLKHPLAHILIDPGAPKVPGAQLRRNGAGGESYWVVPESEFNRWVDKTTSSMMRHPAEASPPSSPTSRIDTLLSRIDTEVYGRGEPAPLPMRWPLYDRVMPTFKPSSSTGLTDWAAEDARLRAKYGHSPPRRADWSTQYNPFASAAHSTSTSTSTRPAAPINSRGQTVRAAPLQPHHDVVAYAPITITVKGRVEVVPAPADERFDAVKTTTTSVALLPLPAPEPGTILHPPSPSHPPSPPPQPQPQPQPQSPNCPRQGGVIGAAPLSECVVCLEDHSDWLVCVPCGHMCLCAGCRDALVDQAGGNVQGVQCPACRTQVIMITKVYKV